MSERARDPQPWDFKPNTLAELWRIEDEIIAFAGTSETIRYLPDGSGRFLYRPRTTMEPWKRRTSLASFAWACLYVLATTRVGRAITSVLVVALTLAFCLALLVGYFWMAGWAPR